VGEVGVARVSGEARLGICGAENAVLAALPPRDRLVVAEHSELVELNRGEALFGPGEAVKFTYFPNVGTVLSLCLLLVDGRTVEAATIGCEGMIGGVVSCGTQPAFASAVVQISGAATRLPIRYVEMLKDKSPETRRLFERYADFLLSQALQSVGCNTFHPIDARLCRWLLTTQDRIGRSEIPLTQEALAQMLGVQRTTISAIGKYLQEHGVLRFRRGSVEIVDRKAVEDVACECYTAVERQRIATLVGPVRSDASQ